MAVGLQFCTGSVCKCWIIAQNNFNTYEIFMVHGFWKESGFVCPGFHTSVESANYHIFQNINCYFFSYGCNPVANAANCPGGPLTGSAKMRQMEESNAKMMVVFRACNAKCTTCNSAHTPIICI